MKQFSIAILGFGTVGLGVYRVLTEGQASIRHREGIQVDVNKILVRDFVNEPNIDKAPREIFVTDVQEILSDSDISLVVECMGGVEPARTFILGALNAGKTVVTSNKEVIAKHWPEFVKAAKASGAGLYIEATVGGGIPIIRTVIDAMQGNNINRVMGIVNGTTNYILTRMKNEGADFADVLKDAQKLGYAEANPTADVEGFDAMYKLSILGSLAFHAHVPIEHISREGITKLSGADFAAADTLGYAIKLLAIGKKGEEGIEMRVHPTMIPKAHPLAGVNDVFNGIFLTGDAVGDVMLYGRGAGSLPTASAVVSDVIYGCHAQGGHKLPSFKNEAEITPDVKLSENAQGSYCIRFHGDEALASGMLKDLGIGVEKVVQLSGEEGHFALLTAPVKAQTLAEAMAKLSAEGSKMRVDSLLRVEA